MYPKRIFATSFQALRLPALVFFFMAVQSCGDDKPASHPAAGTPPPPTLPKLEVPSVNADSAFNFVKKQVDFGPRVPNSEAHRKCGAWIANEFRRMGLTVIEQKFQAEHYKGTTFNCTNIIAQYKPENPRRLLFAAHWDSRFMADQDTKDKDKPILGADDGASGVGVLLELARVLSQQPLDMGVDFICFDAEDQGNDSDDNQDHSRTWCLGAQHWAQNLHRPNYSPLFGVLLDMVGAPEPRFQKEGISMQAAPSVVNYVWNVAASLGYNGYFVPEMGQSITDDHFFVVQIARIPMIDIINRPGKTEAGFVEHWHTHNDNMNAISKNTLKMVSEVCLHTIYQAHSGSI